MLGKNLAVGGGEVKLKNQCELQKLTKGGQGGKKDQRDEWESTITPEAKVVALLIYLNQD